ncbi:zinc-dependent alcohol dehydrogenase family protein [Paralimibaculum aggregatum]|uniref:Zinc-dependent alcohol dehydrogenase family protein n=1 Tax=Paralimibaculum aggregatum TaxID=3036245 RepID=A0ABQ6LJ22_9RHOB|nr:zinc-dependent alcohol dehydrogenase family protein [Limibaculum sp. NKW23]GMG83254.1 zinc-dependent alcohol dehydrogenase family protein [Limibaculum sp. NKW23]
MRAALLTAYRAPLEIADLPDPDCPADGVVLRLSACGVCRSDWHAWGGADPDIALPQVLGHEYCGVVEEAGPQVTGWRRGDAAIAPFILACGRCADCAAGNQTVCGSQIVPGFTAPGAFAARIAVPRADANLAPLPEGLDPAVAAALGCRVTTAWQALTGRAGLMAGEWLAVHGTGGVGLSAVMLGVALGARVVAVDIQPEKLALAERLGAAAVVDARAGDAAEAIRERTGGGAHVSIEALGIAATTEASLACLRPLGRHVQIGMPAGESARMTLPMDLVYSRQLVLYGTRGMPAWRYPALFRLLEGGRVPLDMLVTRRIGLEGVSAELAAMDGPTPPGVAVVTRF